jgi:predicted secreted hydrolase
VDSIDAALTDAEAAASGAPFALHLTLRSLRDPALHDGDGFVDFGPAGSSYYYSRMRMAATGTVTLDGDDINVGGTAWFDHQWGNFISVGGGWDWFAINLADGTDLTLSVVRDATGNPVLEYGTIEQPTQGSPGSATRLSAEDFSVESLGTWTSPHSARTWPSGWKVSVGELAIELHPTVDDQELDTRATTGVVYWEGSQRVTAKRNGSPVAGEAYVELTRYTN